MWSKSVENRCKRLAVIPSCPWQVSLLDSGHIYSRYAPFKSKIDRTPTPVSFLAIQWYQKKPDLRWSPLCYGHISGELPNSREKMWFFEAFSSHCIPWWCWILKILKFRKRKLDLFISSHFVRTFHFSLKSCKSFLENSSDLERSRSPLYCGIFYFFRFEKSARDMHLIVFFLRKLRGV